MRRFILKSAASFSIVALGVIGIVGSSSVPPINPVTTRIDPSVLTMAAIQGGPDVDNNCSPPIPPAPLSPTLWWGSLPNGQLPKVAGAGVVGFQTWRNTQGQCREYRQDIYRSAFTYDLSGNQPLKGLVTKAEITFSVAAMPTIQGVCQAMTGGGGSLFQLQPGFSLPAGSFIDFGFRVPPHPFPAGGKIFGMLIPWLPGQIANGVVTVDGGGQMAAFTVDVTDRLNGALNRNDTSIGFMLSALEEGERVPSQPPSGDIDCRTIYRFGQLVIQHL